MERPRRVWIALIETEDDMVIEAFESEELAEELTKDQKRMGIWPIWVQTKTRNLRLGNVGEGPNWDDADDS